MTGLKPDTTASLILPLVTMQSEYSGRRSGMAIGQSEELTAMDDWSQHHHGQSGLIDRVNSTLDERLRRSRRSTFFRYSDKTPPRCVVTAFVRTSFLANYARAGGILLLSPIWMSFTQELVKRWKPDIQAGLQKKTPASHGRHQGFGERADVLPGTFSA